MELLATRFFLLPFIKSFSGHGLGMNRYLFTTLALTIAIFVQVEREGCSAPIKRSDVLVNNEIFNTWFGTELTWHYKSLPQRASVP